MGELIKKELKVFFASLSGYIVLVFFLLTNSLFLWIIPGVYNIPESGMADLKPFFELAPVLYLFLIPAICMRMFSEEKKTGTIELLFTRPLSVFTIILSKYIAAFLLVILSLLPTIIYAISVWYLAEPAGNIDLGGTIGSYIGTFLLAAVYIAVGIWASSVTDNQIVAFLSAMAVSFLLYAGFEFIGEIPVFASIQEFFLVLGISYHYEPMSRGVLTLSDVFYFFTVILLFIGLTMGKLKGFTFRYLYILLVIVILNVFISKTYYRLDITDDKRYTLSDNTKHLLQELDRNIGIDIFLNGNLPPGMRRLENATVQMLEEFKRITGNKLRYYSVDPSDIRDNEEKKQLIQYLASRGIMPVNLNRTTEDERLEQQIIFPGLIAYDDSTEVSINLLQNVPGYNGEENINHSIEALEYELTKALRLITREEKKSIAFLTGQGELPYWEVSDMANVLLHYYHVDFVSTDSLGIDLEKYDALIIAKPSENFSERDKYVIDQYIMRGGRVLWCVDEVDVNHNLLREQETTFAVYRPLNIEDMLFKYGVRINPDLLLDGNCVLIPVVTGMSGGTPDYQPAPWYYSPLLVPYQQHPVTAGLQPIRIDYANSIDTVGGNPQLKKTVLLSSSPYAALLKTPCPVSLSITEKKMTEEKFNRQFVPVAVMVEGNFESVYRFNRRTEEAVKGEFRSESGYNKMIFVSSGNIIRNEVRGTGENTRVIPLGYDEYSGRLYGNRDFILNCVNTLCDDEGWMRLRARNLSLYLLNKTKLKTESYFWKMLNLFLPVLLVLTGGGIYLTLRKYKYTKK